MLLWTSFDGASHAKTLIFFLAFFISFLLSSPAWFWGLYRSHHCLWPTGCCKKTVASVGLWLLRHNLYEHPVVRSWQISTMCSHANISSTSQWKKNRQPSIHPWIDLCKALCSTVDDVTGNSHCGEGEIPAFSLVANKSKPSFPPSLSWQFPISSTTGWEPKTNTTDLWPEIWWNCSGLMYGWIKRRRLWWINLCTSLHRAACSGSNTCGSRCRDVTEDESDSFWLVSHFCI